MEEVASWITNEAGVIRENKHGNLEDVGVPREVRHRDGALVSSSFGVGYGFRPEDKVHRVIRRPKCFRIAELCGLAEISGVRAWGGRVDVSLPVIRISLLLGSTLEAIEGVLNGT